MNTQEPFQPTTSLFTRAGNAGVPLGLLMAVAVICCGMGVTNAVASLAFFVLFVISIIYVIRIQRKAFRDSGGAFSFLDIWTLGILVYFLGSLFAALTAYISLRFWQPEFIADTVKNTIKIYRDTHSPALGAMADTFQTILDKRLLPTPADVAQQIIALTLIGGSVVSLLATPFVRTAPRNNKWTSQ